MNDDRQLRTTNNAGLIGYRGSYHGKKVIAIMKGKDCLRCIGIIEPDELLEMVEKGPCINLDNIYNN